MCNESAVSVLMFHRFFSAVTYTTLIRDLKSTRLHQARLFMIRTELTVAARWRRSAMKAPCSSVGNSSACSVDRRPKKSSR